MKKLVLVFMIVIGAVSACNAGGLEFFDFGLSSFRGDTLRIPRTEGIYSWKDVDPTIGVAWYSDVDFYNELPEDRNDYLAPYLQIPIVKWDSTRVNFGVIIPSDLDRTRPILGLSYICGDQIEDVPDWLPLEVGAYVVLGPYKAYGAQLGIVRLKF